jgi:thymidylate kinase
MQPPWPKAQVRWPECGAYPRAGRLNRRRDHPHILLSGIAKPHGAETEAILFAAARDDHVRNTILPALNSGTWVICDRFIDSTRVYQGALGNVDQRSHPQP